MKHIVLAFVLCFVLLAAVGCDVAPTKTESTPTPTVTATQTAAIMPTEALDPDDIFDARNHSSEFNIRCACALGSRLNCDHGHFLDKNGEGYDLFVWRENATLDGVPVTKMRDFDESYFVKESEDEPDPNVIEAYGDNTKRYMVFTDGVPNFGDYLFHNMPDVPKIYVPDSVKEIGEHTFDEGCQTVIACHKGSYAEEFANAHGMTVEIVEVGCALNPDDIFDARNHSSQFNIKCACASGNYLNCDHGHFLDKNGEGYDLFVWCGDSTYNDVPVTKMRDFDESYFTNGPASEPTPNVIGLYNDEAKHYMVFTDGVPNFGDYLFHNMPDVPKIYVPDSVKEIGEHTFDEGCKTVIACHKGSYAEEFANAHGMTVEIVE